MHSGYRFGRLQSRLDATIRFGVGLLLVLSVFVHLSARAAPVSFAWDYGSSGEAGFAFYCGQSSGQYTSRFDAGASQTYTVSGLTEGASYYCAVTAYDSSRAESAYSNEISAIVPYSAPVAGFTASTTNGLAPLGVAFTNTTTGKVTAWSWDFGDGTTSTAQNPSHTYANPGSYTVALTATGPGGSSTKQAPTPINVALAVMPGANFTMTPTSGTAPLAVAFTDTSSGTVTSWAWNFGDGTASNVQSPNHSYSSPGSYTVTLTATGPAGSSTKTASMPISVTADTTAPTVSITAPSDGATVAGTTIIGATASDDVGVVGVQFLLDGAVLGAEQPGPAFSLSWNTTATPNGVHTLSARARDAAGNVAITSTVSVTVSNTQPSGLVAAYSFNEGSGSSVADASGNNNKGTLVGAVTWTNQGRFGNALVFDGSSGRVDIADSPSLHLTTAITLEAWVNPTTVSNKWRDVVYKGNDNYYLEGTSNKKSLAAARAGTKNVYATAALPANTWTHLAVTYDNATALLYINGVLVSSLASTAAIATSTYPLQIGGDSIYGQYFQGLIDEVRVYNRALSQSEIQADMNTPVSP